MKQDEECRSLLYAGWRHDKRGWHQPGQTVTRVSLQEAVDIQAVRERAKRLVFGNEQENSLAP